MPHALPQLRDLDSKKAPKWIRDYKRRRQDILEGKIPTVPFDGLQCLLGLATDTRGGASQVRSRARKAEEKLKSRRFSFHGNKWEIDVQSLHAFSVTRRTMDAWRSWNNSSAVTPELATEFEVLLSALCGIQLAVTSDGTYK